MKIQAQLLECVSKSYTDKNTGITETSIRITVIVPHDVPSDGFQIISGSISNENAKGIEKLKRGEQKYPAPCSADVTLAPRSINGYAATTLKLTGVQVGG